jgi:hypothetical protein
LAWYLDRGRGQREYKLKAAIPSFIHAVSELHMFRCLSFPPIVYQGHEHAKMLHFVFVLEATQGNLRAFSKQDDRHIIELPLMRCENGNIRPAAVQHDGFSWDAVASLTAMLPPAIASRLDDPSLLADDDEVYDE